MIKKKDINREALYQSLERDNVPYTGLGSGIDLKIIEVPEVLKKFDTIYALGLRFKKEVFLPDWMKTKRIGKLFIDGTISDKEQQKILDWYPNTEIELNGKKHHEGKNTWIRFWGKEIPKEVLKSKHIWILEILNPGPDGHDLIIPDELGKIKIEILSLMEAVSDENLKKIKRLLPDTDIYVDGEKLP